MVKRLLSMVSYARGPPTSRVRECKMPDESRYSIASEEPGGVKMLPLLRFYVITGACVAAALGFVGNEAEAISCPGNVSVNYSPTEDISQTGTGTCINITANNITVNLSGKRVICNRAAGCDTAVGVSVDVTQSLIKNGFIENGTGTWATGVFAGQYAGGGNAATTTVQDLTIDGATTGIASWHKVQRCIIKNVSGACLDSGAAQLPNNSEASQVFCRSLGDGIIATPGNSSSNNNTIKNNYVDAANGVAIEALTGYIVIEHNIIGEATSFIVGNPVVPSKTTISENICDDTVCPDPSSNFNLSVNFE